MFHLQNITHLFFWIRSHGDDDAQSLKKDRPCRVCQRGVDGHAGRELWTSGEEGGRGDEDRDRGKGGEVREKEEER